MKYLTVGTREITKDKFIPVEDTDLTYSMKPKGGIWFTEHDQNIKKFNRWVDVILDRPNILFYKNKETDPFVQPCSLVTLKEDTNIYALHNEPTLDYLFRCFPYNGKFSYEELSHYYDGIFVNLDSLKRCNYDNGILSKFSSFDVSSLILFNLDCVDYYQSGEVMIEPFDYEGGERSFDYEINISNVRKKILKK